MRGLPADQAEIVLLRVLGDLDVDQVAAIVGKSTGAVRIAQHRASAAAAIEGPVAAEKRSCNTVTPFRRLPG